MTDAMTNQIADEIERFFRGENAVADCSTSHHGKRDYKPEDFASLPNHNTHLTGDYWGSEDLQVVPILEMEVKRKINFQSEMNYPILEDEEVQRKFVNSKQNLSAWHINAGNYQRILHFLLYKEENVIRDLFSQFQSWEVSLGIFSGCPKLAHGSIGDGEMLGIFLLPGALLQEVCRSKKLGQFAKEKIHISPAECTSRTKKFYEAHVLVRDSEVWVKIPKQCVIDARLSVGSFMRFQVIFGFDRSVYRIAHTHVDAVNIFFESATADSFQGNGVQYIEKGWERLTESIDEGRAEFLKTLQELLCFYDAFY